MATIVKTDSENWKALVRLQGYPSASKTFRLKRDAEDWARQTEGDMRKGLYIDRADSVKMSIRDALERYKLEILPTKRPSTAKNERLRLAQLQVVFGKYTLAALTPTLIAEFRDRRLAAGKSANTVRLDLTLLSHLYTVAMQEWGLGLVRNPVTQVRKPSLVGTARTRRVSKVELDKLFAECRSHSNPQLGWVVELALETAMRKSEILGLQTNDIDLERRLARLTLTKNGDARSVPLTRRAVEILSLAITNPLRPADTHLLFFGEPGRAGNIAHYTIEKLFSEARSRAGLTDFKFHDLRHEATSRLVEKRLSDLEVSAITSHKSMQMLKRYAHLRGADLVKLLDQT
jgi:integrase